MGDVVDRPGRRARGPGHRRRADVREGHADQRRDVDGRRASCSSSGKTGDVVGQAGGVLVMRNIDSTVEIGIDEEVFTAGLELDGGIRSPYPQGLLIGSVVDVERDANDVVQTAFLAPAANLDSFELALVITDYDGGLPPVDEQPVPCGDERDGARGRGPVLHAAPRAAGEPEGDAQALASAGRAPLRRRASRPRACADAALPRRRAACRRLLGLRPPSVRVVAWPSSHGPPSGRIGPPRHRPCMPGRCACTGCAVVHDRCAAERPADRPPARPGRRTCAAKFRSPCSPTWRLDATVADDSVRADARRARSRHRRRAPALEQARCAAGVSQATVAACRAGSRGRR